MLGNAELKVKKKLTVKLQYCASSYTRGAKFGYIIILHCHTFLFRAVPPVLPVRFQPSSMQGISTIRTSHRSYSTAWPPNTCGRELRPCQIVKPGATTHLPEICSKIYAISLSPSRRSFIWQQGLHSIRTTFGKTLLIRCSGPKRFWATIR